MLFGRFPYSSNLLYWFFHNNSSNITVVLIMTCITPNNSEKMRMSFSGNISGHLTTTPMTQDTRATQDASSHEPHRTQDTSSPVHQSTSSLPDFPWHHFSHCSGFRTASLRGQSKPTPVFYTAHCTLRTAHCTLHTAQVTLLAEQNYTLNTANWSLLGFDESIKEWFACLTDCLTRRPLYSQPSCAQHTLYTAHTSHTSFHWNQPQWLRPRLCCEATAALSDKFCLLPPADWTG